LSILDEGILKTRRAHYIWYLRSSCKCNKKYDNNIKLQYLFSPFTFFYSCSCNQV